MPGMWQCVINFRASISKLLLSITNGLWLIIQESWLGKKVTYIERSMVMPHLTTACTPRPFTLPLMELA